MKHLAFGLLVLLIMIVIGFWGNNVANQELNEEVYQRGYAAGYAHIKSISELQEQVGAEPDGIWGCETDRLYRETYNNQEYKLICERMSK